MIPSRDKARRGEELLREAVLELLAAAPNAMIRKEIHLEAGVTTCRDRNAPYSLIKGILNLLRDDGLVYQEGGKRSGWRLTGEGIAKDKINPRRG